MSIIEEAETFKWKETQTEIAETLKKIDFPIQNLAFYEVLRFFDLTTADKLKNPEVLRRVETIYKYFKDSEDILTDLRRLNSKLGNPFDLEERLNKIYSFIYSENLEKGLEEEKELKDKKLTEELAKGRAEKEKMEKEKEKIKRQERLRERLKEIEREEAIGKERYFRVKQEKEFQERMAEIEETTLEKSPLFLKK